MSVLTSHPPWLLPTFYILLTATQDSHPRWPQTLHLTQRTHSSWCPHHPHSLSPLRAVFTLGIKKCQLPWSVRCTGWGTDLQASKAVAVCLGCSPTWLSNQVCTDLKSWTPVSNFCNCLHILSTSRLLTTGNILKVLMYLSDFSHSKVSIQDRASLYKQF